jgi:NADH:ubiquinone oxidoreductase subunit 3 (subunit A)
MALEDSSYLVIAVFLAAAVVIALVPLALARIWASQVSPAKPGADKNATYECGLVSEGDAWIRFKSEYYLYGIIFLVFDVETIFLLPFAVAFTSLSAGGFVAMMLFLLLLVEGLVWAWRKGLLVWGRG